MERQMTAEVQSGRRTVISYGTYAEAQRAVDYLSDNNFPVQRIAIVAEGIRFVEQVTGRLNYGRALLNGAASGASTGLFVSLLLGLFGVAGAAGLLSLALYGLVFGAILGAILGVIAYALTGGRRDFTSVSGMQAERYSVMVDADVAGEAINLLNAMNTGR
jgi:hypothetical protein